MRRNEVIVHVCAPRLPSTHSDLSVMLPTLDWLYLWAFGCCGVLLSYFLFSHTSQTKLNIVNPVPLSNETTSAFQASRLTPSAFLIKEYNDIYDEHPHIYVKVVPSANTILVIDTGCGGASNDPDVKVRNLREFIETIGVDDNEGKPLNKGGAMKYVVVTTHCHYDHIRMAFVYFSIVID